MKVLFRKSIVIWIVLLALGLAACGGAEEPAAEPAAQPTTMSEMAPTEEMMDEATAATVRDLVQRGVLGPGVLTVDDCRARYEELRKRGVQFQGEPQERPYGIEALLRDDSGNWFSMTQPR